MQSLTNLTKGLEIIEPFLRQHDFEFMSYKNGKDSAGEFVLGTYKNQSKKFLIDYRFSIGQVLYQFENSLISHSFYLDHLGFSEKKRCTDFLSDNHPETFKQILYDFNFLVDDFFKGECRKLVEFSELHDNIIYELDEKIRNENSFRTDRIKIEKARMEFRKKDFKNSLEIYRAVYNSNLLGDLDNRIIEFCKQHCL